MTSTDLLSLRAAVCASPAEDTPRLMYADELESNGGERGALWARFIRSQCEFERTFPIISGPGIGTGSRQAECGQCYAVWNGRQHTSGPCRCAPDFRAAKRDLYNLFDEVSDDLIAELGSAWTDDAGHDESPPASIPKRIRAEFHMYTGHDFEFMVRRGFVDEWRTPALEFLKHADALLWHPDQRVKCDRCQGVRRMWVEVKHGWSCPLCGDEGFKGRPCPPTAQPIRRVTLTTLPSFNSRPCEYVRDEGGRLGVDPRADVSRKAVATINSRGREHKFNWANWHDTDHAGRVMMLFGAEWPWVRFEVLEGATFQPEPSSP